MSATWKTVRVFISSTFRDMQAERDHLVRFVFPRLREELLARRIHLVDVDLRWGVTSDQDASEVCREVVDECHPRFLCMLGGRYGWVPKGKARSITADEIHYGVLDREITKRGFSFFYFRDESATAAMVETAAGEFREPQGSDNQSALCKLKQAIADARLNPFTYPAQWDEQSRRLISLAQFGNQVHDDLLRSLREDFELRDYFSTSAEKLGEFAEENAAMESFVAERTERFVLGSRKAVMDELLAHANGTRGHGYLCLVGEPGSGKSALLAHFSQHSNLNDQTSTLLISHFVGASTGSTDVRRTLRRLCHELISGTGITAEIPEDPEKLRVAFPEILKQACAKKRIVILLDAVNQFDTSPQLAELWWLPEELPDNARTILSTLPGKTLDDLKRRRNPPREVLLLALTQTDGEAIIKEFLHRYRKTMTDAQRATLLKKKDAGIPLYLLAALEELRTLGTYEEITDRIAQLPDETQALFTWILKRLEDDDGFRDALGRKIGVELVSRFAALMGVSRHGLSQRELAELLAPGDSKATISDDAQGNVAALVQLLRPYLMRRGELLDFYHGQFREAAEAAHLDSPEKQRAAHQSVATCLQAFADPHRDGQCRDASPHALSELPHHQTRAEAWPDLIATLENIFFLEAKVTNGMTFNLAMEFTDAVNALPPEHLQRQRLRLLEEGLRRDLHFIARHALDYPQALFQSLWNSSLWYDSAERSEQSDSPSANRHSLSGSLCDLLEAWRNKREISTGGFIWLRSIRPPAKALGSNQRAILRGHEGFVNCVAVSCDGRFIASGSDDKSVRVWDAATGQCIQCLRKTDSIVFNSKPVLSIAFSPTRPLIASGSQDSDLRMWDYETGRLLWSTDYEPENYGGVSGLAFSADGELLYCAGTNPFVKVRNSSNGKLIGTRGENSYRFNRVKASGDGSLLALASSLDDVAILQDAATNQTIFTMRGGDDIMSAIAISADGSLVVTASREPVIRVWDVKMGNCRFELPAEGYYTECLDLSADGKLLVSGGNDWSVHLWDLISGKELVTLGGHGYHVSGVALLSSSQVPGRRPFVVSCSYDRTVRIWDTPGDGSATQASDRSFVQATAFSPDGKYLATGNDDGVVTLWDPFTGNILHELTAAKNSIHSLMFSRTGDHLYISPLGGGNKVWKTMSDQEPRLIPLEEGRYETSVEFSAQWRAIRERELGSNVNKERIWEGNQSSVPGIPYGPFCEKSEGVELEICLRSSWKTVAREPGSYYHISWHPSGRIWCGRDGSRAALFAIEGDS